MTKGSGYAETHAVAAEAQRRNVQWIAYESVRSPGQQSAVVFDSDSLSEPVVGLEDHRADLALIGKLFKGHVHAQAASTELGILMQGAVDRP